MGCDIHYILEVKVNKKWVGIDTNRRFNPQNTAANRDYGFFTQLASVRGDSKRKPNGVPKNASDLSKLWIKQWGVDGHSHSHMSVEDFSSIWKAYHLPNLDSYSRKYPEGELFGLDYEIDKGEYRVIFFFDN